MTGTNSLNVVCAYWSAYQNINRYRMVLVHIFLFQYAAWSPWKFRYVLTNSCCVKSVFCSSPRLQSSIQRVWRITWTWYREGFLPLAVLHTWMTPTDGWLLRIYIPNTRMHPNCVVIAWSYDNNASWLTYCHVSALFADLKSDEQAIYLCALYKISVLRIFVKTLCWKMRSIQINEMLCSTMVVVFLVNGLVQYTYATHRNRRENANWPTDKSSFTDTERREILRKHNSYRSIPGATVMVALVSYHTHTFVLDTQHKIQFWSTLSVLYIHSYVTIVG